VYTIPEEDSRHIITEIRTGASSLKCKLARFRACIRLCSIALRKMLKTQGNRVTATRLAVACYMYQNKEHPTAQQIYQDVQKTVPSISMNTIYLSLKFLQNINFIVELDLVNGNKRYDSNTKPHAHLICHNCGHIEDWNDTSLMELESKILEDTGFAPNEWGYFVGRCKRCRNKARGFESSDAK